MMFDFIVNNIFVLIPLAIFIGLRVLEARKKAEEKSEAAWGKGGGATDGNFGFFGEDDEPAERETKPVIKETFPLSPRPAAVLSAAKKETHLVSSIFKKAADKSPKEELPASIGQEVRGKIRERNGLSAKLERLSPIRRAVVMAEILGPPKGI